MNKVEDLGVILNIVISLKKGKMRQRGGKRSGFIFHVYIVRASCTHICVSCVDLRKLAHARVPVTWDNGDGLPVKLPAKI